MYALTAAMRYMDEYTISKGNTLNYRSHEERNKSWGRLVNERDYFSFSDLEIPNSS